MQKFLKIEISTRTIVFTVLFILSLQVLWMVRELLFSLFIAFIITSSLSPLVSKLEARRVPRGISALIIFILLFSLVGYLFYWIVPPLVTETTQLFKNLPTIINRLNPQLSQFFQPELFTQYLPNVTSNAFSVLRSVFSNLVFVLSTIVFSFYFLVEQNAIKKFLIRFFAKRQAADVAATLEKAERRMRSWFWGELSLMIIVGLMSFIGLTLMGVKYAVPLALIAGLLEIAPVIGPILSAIPAFAIASSQSYFLGLAVIALYFVIQQLENQIIVPQIMKRAVGLNPIVTLIALIVGGKVGGFLGVLLAIPITLFLETVLVEYLKTKGTSV